MVARLRYVGIAVSMVLLTDPAAFGAFSMNYGAFSGATIDYLDVTESNTGATALFGAPSVSGDLLDFDPIGFVAASSGAAVITDGQLNFIVMSKRPSQPITTLVFNESGDYTLAALSGLAKATVGMAIRVNVLEVNGVPMHTAGTTQTMTFAPVGSGGNGTYLTPANVGTAVPWSGNLVYDVSAIKAGATKVEVVLDNTLTSEGANGGSARIAKKDFSGVTVTTPEPSSASMFLVLTVAGSLLARRK